MNQEFTYYRFLYYSIPSGKVYEVIFDDEGNPVLTLVEEYLRIYELRD